MKGKVHPPKISIFLVACSDIYPSRLSWCEPQSFSYGDVCLLSNKMGLNCARLVLLKALSLYKKDNMFYFKMNLAGISKRSNIFSELKLGVGFCLNSDETSLCLIIINYVYVPLMPVTDLIPSLESFCFVILQISMDVAAHDR